MSTSSPTTPLQHLKGACPKYCVAKVFEDKAHSQLASKTRASAPPSPIRTNRRARICGGVFPRKLKSLSRILRKDKAKFPRFDDVCAGAPAIPPNEFNPSPAPVTRRMHIVDQNIIDEHSNRESKRSRRRHKRSNIVSRSRSMIRTKHSGDAKNSKGSQLRRARSAERGHSRIQLDGDGVPKSHHIDRSVRFQR